MADNTQTWADLLREIPVTLPSPDVFIAELERMDVERKTWTPRKRRMMRLKRPWYRLRWWLILNVTWRFARTRNRPDYY